MVTRALTLSLSVLLLSLSAWAQEAAPATAPAAPAAENGMLDFLKDPTTLFLAAGVLLLMVLAKLLLLLVLFQMRPVIRKLLEIESIRHSWSGRLLALFVGDATALTGTVRDEVMEGHDYDGIEEFDNDLPPWWKYSFYATIFFGAVYLIYYHVSDVGKLSDAEYQHEMAIAAQMSAASGEDDPNKPTDYQPLTAAGDITSGKDLYMQNCAACHGSAAEGKVGPNLTDEFWLHGGEVNKVFKTVKYGVVSKGMVAWQKKLSNKQILQVSSYILSLQGSKPANAKEPQGEKYEAKVALQ
jgi:cytochrome c oxidase cbb3-type subunit 3